MSDASENITVVQDGLDKHQKWSHVAVMCLLEILWEQFEKAKVSMMPRKLIFENTAREMKKNGFSYTKYDIQKKYTNMTGSYRRIHACVRISKHTEKLTWPYYEIMKEIREKELDCRVPLRSTTESQPPTKRIKYGNGDPSTESRSAPPFEEDSSYPPPPTKREKAATVSSAPSRGVAVGSAGDLSAFANQWEEKRFALEDFKMQLIETLFKDVKQQRSEAEEDSLTQLHMRQSRNKHLKEIVGEMSRLRTDVRRELSSLSESINDLISAIRNTAR